MLHQVKVATWKRSAHIFVSLCFPLLCSALPRFHFAFPYRARQFMSLDRHLPTYLQSQQQQKIVGITYCKIKERERKGREKERLHPMRVFMRTFRAKEKNKFVKVSRHWCHGSSSSSSLECSQLKDHSASFWHAHLHSLSIASAQLSSVCVLLLQKKNLDAVATQPWYHRPVQVKV